MVNLARVLDGLGWREQVEKDWLVTGGGLRAWWVFGGGLVGLEMTQ